MVAALLCVSAGCGDADVTPDVEVTGDGVEVTGDVVEVSGDVEDETLADIRDEVAEVDVLGDVAPDVSEEVGPWVCEHATEAGAAPLASDLIARPEAAVGRPIIVDVDGDLGLGPGFTLSAMSVHPTARRMYLGRYGSYDPLARDVRVVAFDAEGHVVRTRSVSVSTARRAAGVAVSAQQLVVAADDHKLYVASTPLAGNTDIAFESLAVLDLDADGEPFGTARTYDPGVPYGLVYALAKNPVAPVLYVAGYGDPQVRIVPLDATGEPTGDNSALPIDVFAPVDGVGIADLVASRDGRFLYVGGVGALEAYALADDGRSAQRVAAIDLPALPEGVYDYTRMTLAGDRIVRRSGGFPAGPATALPLTSVGLVDGVPSAAAISVSERALVDAVGLASGELFAVLEDSYRDVIDDSVVSADLSLVRGPATAPVAIEQLRLKSGVLAAAFDDGTPVVLVADQYVAGSRQRDLRVRARIDAADFEGVAMTDPDYIFVAQFMLIGSDYYEAAQVTLGEMSQWYTYDRVLEKLAYAPTAYLSIAGAPTHVALTIEVALGDPTAGGKLLKRVSVETDGGEVLLRVPGLGVPADELAVNVQLERDVSIARSETAAAVGLGEDERPKQYPIGCYSIIGVQADAIALGALADTVASLGCNMVIPIAWSGLPAEVVRDALDSRGITRRSGSTYTPPSYFDFDTDENSDEALTAWADETVFYSVPHGESKDTIGHVVIADEPAWYYPTMLDVVRDSPDKLSFFHRYLEEQGLVPDDFEAADWSEVTPLGKPLDTSTLTLPERMRLYWTLRFFPVSAARGLGHAAEFIKTAVGRDLPVHVNWNNWGTTAWHYNGWDAHIENNPTEVGPERGTGSVDWFEAGRIGKQALFSEDWVPDSWLDLWSYRLDILRSAATQADHRPADEVRDGPVPFGSYVIPNASGHMREGMSYKILSMLGRGGKQLEMFNFGPTSLQADGWSDQTILYEPIARALRRVAKAEHVMFPAVPERGRVAIALPSESLYFDEWAETDYMYEAEALHRALVHAGFRVDIVDAQGLSDGELAHRGYAVLYVAGPNVPTAARANIAAWVAAGGTLVMMPGAATADAYDTITSDLDEVLGLAPRVREHSPLFAPYEQRPSLGSAPTDVVTAAAGAMTVERELPVVGRLVALDPTSAEVVATFADGRPAITANTYGAGRAIAYAFLAGNQYEAAMPREVTGELPSGDGANPRHFAVWPAVSAAAYGSVRTVPMSGEDGELLEALRLDGPAGTAIVLLDWGQASRSCLRLHVAGVAGFGRVSSVEGRHVSSEVVGDGREVVLERLDAIDILLFEP